MNLILGTAQLNRPYGALDSYRRLPRLHRPLELLAAAEDSEISAFDTAPVYGDAEALLGVSGVTKPIYTKLDPSVSVEESIRQSKSRLSLKSLHCVYLHEELTANSCQTKILEGLASHLSYDVQEIGVSIYSLEEYELALGISEVSVIQVPYGILDRRFSAETLKRAADLGKRVLARSIFLQGLLTTPNTGELRNFPGLSPFILEFREVTRAHGVSPVAAALAFASQNKGLAGMIVGVRSKDALRAVLGEAKKQLSPQVFSDLMSLASPPPEMVDPRNW